MCLLRCPRDVRGVRNAHPLHVLRPAAPHHHVHHLHHHQGDQGVRELRSEIIVNLFNIVTMTFTIYSTAICDVKSPIRNRFQFTKQKVSMFIPPRLFCKLLIFDNDANCALFSWTYKYMFIIECSSVI